MSWQRVTRVFIIARFKDGALFEALRDELAKSSIVLSHDWYTPMKNRKRGRQDASRARALVADIAGIRKADYVISLLPRGNDSFVEIGAAIMAEKPIILVSCHGLNDIGYAEHPHVIARPQIAQDTPIEIFAETIKSIITWDKARKA